MADQSNRTPGGRVVDAPSAGQAAINWDHSSMRRVSANACSVSGSREEIIVLFGMNRARHAGQKEVTIQLADRIVMTPLAAKRFAELLNNVIKEYETNYGELG